jgi:protein tyrosine/serine phosphatase
MLKWLKRLGKGLALVLVLFGLYVVYLKMSGNFHEVIAGELYRSAQPTSARLDSYVAQYKIRTVINLRGADLNTDWYREEMAASSRLGLNHIDFKMSASQELSIGEVRQLITIMRDAPKPLLIHCKDGADRTGLASVIYTQQIAGYNEELAELQLSPYYGHVGIPLLSPTFAMDVTWEKIEKAFGIES